MSKLKITHWNAAIDGEFTEEKMMVKLQKEVGLKMAKNNHLRYCFLGLLSEIPQVFTGHRVRGALPRGGQVADCDLGGVRVHHVWRGRCLEGWRHPPRPKGGHACRACAGPKISRFSRSFERLASRGRNLGRALRRILRRFRRSTVSDKYRFQRNGFFYEMRIEALIYTMKLVGVYFSYLK